MSVRIGKGGKGWGIGRKAKRWMGGKGVENKKEEGKKRKEKLKNEGRNDILYLQLFPAVFCTAGPSKVSRQTLDRRCCGKKKQ